MLNRDPTSSVMPYATTDWVVVLRSQAWNMVSVVVIEMTESIY